MLDGRNISSKALVDGIFRDYGFSPTEVDLEAVLEHIYDAMILIGVPTAFHDEVDTVSIADYRGDLPCGLIDISPGGIRLHNTYQPLIYSTDRFYSVTTPPETVGNTLDVNAPYYSTYSDMPTIDDGGAFTQYYTYYLNDSYIFTNFEDGYVDIAYKAFPVDSEGWPNIPDNVRYIKGVKAYVAERIGFKLWMRSEISDKVYAKLEADRNWGIASANGAGRIPSLDQMESLKNQWLTLIPDTQQHLYSYRYLNRRSHVRTHTS